jgi:KAP family P-loop domain
MKKADVRQKATMQKRTKPSILDDQPASKDMLGFAPYVDALAEIITGLGIENTPLTIGVFGSWGMGKTSLMKQLQTRLINTHRFRSIWFDAWKFDKEDALWRALLLRILDALRPKPTAKGKKATSLRESIQRMEESLYHDVTWTEYGRFTVDWTALTKDVAKTGLKFGLSLIPGAQTIQEVLKIAGQTVGSSDPSNLVGAIQRDSVQHYQAQLRAMEQFCRQFEQLVKTYVRPKKLVIFVDDLDRCIPEKAIEVLEATKLFFDVPGCIFVLGLDQDVISRGIQARYHEFSTQTKITRQDFPIDGTRYLEKIIQIPFLLPPIEDKDLERFVKRLVRTYPDKRCVALFAQGLMPNPRHVKRTINVFFLLWRLSQKRKELRGKICALRLAKVVVIQQAHPDLYARIIEDNAPQYLQQLERYFKTHEKLSEGDKAGSASDRGKVIEPGLDHFTERRLLQRLFTMHRDDEPDANFSGLDADDLRMYITLARQVETTPAAAVVSARIRRARQSLQNRTDVSELEKAVAEAERLMNEGAEDVRLTQLLEEAQTVLTELKRDLIGYFSARRSGEYQSAVEMLQRLIERGVELIRDEAGRTIPISEAYAESVATLQATEKAKETITRAKKLMDAGEFKRAETALQDELRQRELLPLSMNEEVEVLLHELERYTTGQEIDQLLRESRQALSADYFEEAHGHLDQARVLAMHLGDESRLVQINAQLSQLEETMERRGRLGHQLEQIREAQQQARYEEAIHLLNQVKNSSYFSLGLREEIESIQTYLSEEMHVRTSERIATAKKQLEERQLDRAKQSSAEARRLTHMTLELDAADQRARIDLDYLADLSAQIDMMSEAQTSS